jgi:hypothetical protein
LSEGRSPASAVLNGEVSDGACPKWANYTQRQITTTPARAILEGQEVAAIYSGLMWQAVIEGLVAQDFARLRGKAVGEPDEGRPHVRFEVAGDGNQDMVRASEALPEETGSNGYAQPTSQAPSPDPTT